MKQHKTAIAPFMVKEADAGSRTFAGLASTWDLDLGGDIIHKGAFRETLAHWQSNRGSRSIPLLDQHKSERIDDVLGSLLEAEETDDGLFARFEVDEGTKGDMLLRHIRKNRLNGLSIGYQAIDPERDEKGVRHLKRLNLHEISAVIWPMNPNARFDPSSVKSLTEAIRSGDLRDEDLTELRAALLAPATATDPAPATAAKDAAPDPDALQVDALIRDVELWTLTL